MFNVVEIELGATMKSTLKCITTLIILLTITPIHASTIDWEIRFFNNKGILVGDGEFSYDPSTFVTFSTQSINPSQEPDRITVNTSFTHLAWRFSGRELWTINNEKAAIWWGGGSLIPSRTSSHFGPFILGESQASSGGSFRNSFLRLIFNGVNTDLIATGKWEQTLNLGIGDFSGSGTWSANALVPIPSTILLFGSGLFSLILAKRKRSNA